jgi:hypothetical protein
VSDFHKDSDEAPQNQEPAPNFGEQASTGRGFKGSLFRSRFAPNVKTIAFSSPEALARTIRATIAPDKSALPWFKLALFSGERTANGCCRCDAFVTTLTGCEGDYDAGEITVLDAALWFRAAGIEAVIGETASSTPEAPRWRVWLPASREYTGTPDELRTLRQRWVARANGVLNGKLAGESFTLSQSYYIGGIKDRPRPTVIVTRGRRIDLLADLDAGAIFKSGRSAPSERFQPAGLPLDLTESDDDPLLLAECRWRVVNFTAKEGVGTDPGGQRAFQLVNWLGDISNSAGKTPSSKMIREGIRESYPDTKIPLIKNMLARRHHPRGWNIINPKEGGLLDEDLEALEPAD